MRVFFFSSNAVLNRLKESAHVKRRKRFIIYEKCLKYSIPLGLPTAQHHDFRIGGSEAIDFLKISKVTTTVKPDTTSSGFTTPQVGQIKI